MGAGQREGGWRRPAELPEGSPPAHQDEVSPSGYTDWAFSAAVDPHMKREMWDEEGKEISHSLKLPTVRPGTAKFLA